MQHAPLCVASLILYPSLIAVPLRLSHSGLNMAELEVAFVSVADLSLILTVCVATNFCLR